MQKINHLITLAFIKIISSLMTEDYLAKRAERGSRQKFEAAMAQVADIEPPDYDK